MKELLLRIVDREPNLLLPLALLTTMAFLSGLLALTVFLVTLK